MFSNKVQLGMLSSISCILCGRCWHVVVTLLGSIITKYEELLLCLARPN